LARNLTDDTGDFNRFKRPSTLFFFFFAHQ